MASEVRFEARLKGKGLLPSTRKKYVEIVESAGNVNLLAWIRDKAHSGMPIGTVLPMRAAVKHYLISELGYEADQLDELLPEARGRATAFRSALTPSQLAQYHAAIEQVDREPAHIILTLLPMTGLLVSEICSLKVENLQIRGEQPLLSFRRGHKDRVVPLGKSAKLVLDRYIGQAKPTTWLFPTQNYTGPISPHGLRKYTRRIAAMYTELSGLSPQVLRATYAVLALQGGVDLVRLQHALGHESIEATRRYRHLERDIL